MLGAIQGRHTEVALLLIDKGVDVNINLAVIIFNPISMELKYNMFTFFQRGVTHLMKACALGLKEITAALLKKGADFKATDEVIIFLEK